MQKHLLLFASSFSNSSTSWPATGVTKSTALLQLMADSPKAPTYKISASHQRESTHGSSSRFLGVDGGQGIGDVRVIAFKSLTTQPQK